MKQIIILFLFFIAIPSLINSETGIKEDSNKNDENSIYSADSSGYFIDKYQLTNKNYTLLIHNNGSIGSEYDSASLGTYRGIDFLYAGGFMLSGYNEDSLWVSGGAEFDRVNNFVPGPIETTLGGIWVVKSSDLPFGNAWQEWMEAVELGADFIDGNDDGEYNPIDLNNNGVWNDGEDAPLILGDETIWTVYNDGVPESERLKYNYVSPLGIEIRQTIFTFEDDNLEDAVFFRYEVLNTGLFSDTLTDVIFSSFVDPDIGRPVDDLAGTDTIRNAAFAYNEGDDEGIEEAPPAFMTTLVNGPVKYIPGETFTDINDNNVFDEGIDIPLDSAKRFYNNLEEPEILPGAKNLNLSSSFIIRQPDFAVPDHSTKWEMRNYMEGKTTKGEYLDPCSYPFTEVKGNVDCEDVNPIFAASGDPVEETGWITTDAADLRMILNVGKFDLVKDAPEDILIAYAVGQGTDEINSIKVARNYVDNIHKIVGNEFVVSVNEKNHGSNIISDFSLAQNYPNPFNPSTNLEFSIPERSFVTLKVYDILGRAISTIVNENLEAGDYSRIFSADEGISSGVYIYSISAEGISGERFIKSGKMTLLK